MATAPTLQSFTELMAQVGATAFALMFAAVQFRWRDWHGTRLGKLSATTALLELLTITVISTSYGAPWPHLWRIVAVACAVLGYVLTTAHLREYNRRLSIGLIPTPADRFQRSWGWAPYASYGTLVLCGVASYHDTVSWKAVTERLPKSVIEWGSPVTEALGWPTMWQAWLATVLVWFLISGLTEVYVTLSPNMLEPEIEHRLTPIRITFRSPLQIDPKTFSAALVSPTMKPVSNRGIVLMPDIWGLKPDVVAMADRLASEGHHVIVPDYYNGRARFARVLSVFRESEERTVEFSHMAQASRQLLLSRYCSEGIAAVGLSIGGSACLLNLEGWDGVAVFYPETSVEYQLPSQPPPIAVFYGLRDRAAVKRSAETLRKVLGDGSVREPYPTARHGFMGTGRSVPWLLRLPLSRHVGPDTEAAEAAWQELRLFLHSVWASRSESERCPLLIGDPPRRTSWREKLSFWRCLRIRLTPPASSSIRQPAPSATSDHLSTVQQQSDADESRDRV